MTRDRSWWPLEWREKSKELEDRLMAELILTGKIGANLQAKALIGCLARVLANTGSPGFVDEACAELKVQVKQLLSGELPR